MNITDIASPGTILLGYRGSIAHGTYVPSEDPDSIDDIDYMGIVIAPPACTLGLSTWHSAGTREVFSGNLDLVEYEIRKMFSLLLVCNPNVLCLLYLKPEMYITRFAHGDDILKHRELFVSKRAYKSYCGYANSQLQKMDRMAGRGFRGEKRKELFDRFGYDTKNASHCIRLLRQGVEFLSSGKMVVDRTGIDAEELLAIKTGMWSHTQVKEEADRLFAFAREAYEHSPLPERPEIEKAEELLIAIHMEAYGI